MTWWQVTALANAVTMAAYLAISYAIAKGLWQSRQWRNNKLASATAAIFFTCSIHHGSHTVHLMLPYLSLEQSSGLAMRQAFADAHTAAWEVLTAGVAVWYWTLRGRFPALVRGAAVFEDLKVRQAAEQTLRESEERYRGIVETTSEGVVLLDGEGRIGYTNAQFADVVGRSGGDLVGTAFLDLVADGGERAKTGHRLEQAHSGRTQRWEVELRRADGGLVCAQVALTARVDATGASEGTLAMVADVTEQKNIEAQLRQAQRLDAIGQLAGGVAHDFNNLLTVIDGYAAMLLAEAAGPGRQDLVAIRDAAARAAALTRQLLAFSRSNPAQPRAVDVNDLVGGVEDMLRRLIREDVELKVVAGAAPAMVWADPRQLEQVVVNLAVNSRDAMPVGGHLTIGVGQVELDGAAADRLGADPGGYVTLTVADTGFGIPADVKARIFEPFFTTKEQGKGTGLGLSTAYGIVRQAKGHIQVDSTPGRGTTFRVYLPVAATAATGRPRPVSGQPDRITGGTGTVLLAEDDAAVRGLTERILRAAGYRVIVAVCGRQAIELAKEDGEIDVLLTDVVMPGMNGQQLADRLTAFMPGLRVVFTSAYTRGALAAQWDEATVSFLDKPFTAAALTEKIHAALDGSPARPRRG